MRECPNCERCFEDEVLLCLDDQHHTKVTLPGKTILNRRYRLEKRIGGNALGPVYVARDENLSTRRVAVTTIRAAALSDEDLHEGEVIARFEREMRAAASLVHPNIISVTDFGEAEPGVFFVVHEHVEGESLARLLHREGRLTVRRVFGLLRQACEAVEAAHTEGILHGDLTPANIWLIESKRKNISAEDDYFVKVGNFGLTKLIGPRSDGDSSAPIIESVDYLSPEQIQADTVLDERADLYALGTIAYQMLTGQLPFTGDLMQVVMCKVTQEAPALSALGPDIPANVEKSVLQALAKERADRPQSVAAWFAQIEAAVVSSLPREVAVGSPTDVIASYDHADLSPTSSGSPGAIARWSEPHSSIPETVIVTCKRCGARFAAGGAFCGRCGYPFAGPTGELRVVDTGALDPSRLRQPSIVAAPPASELASSPPKVLAPAPTASRPSLFQRAISGISSLLDRPTSSVGAQTESATSDEVRCSLFAPSYAKQGQQFLLQVFAHLVEQAEEAQRLAVEFDEKTQRRGLRTLEEKIERGTKLTFQLTIPGLVITENVQTMMWRALPEPEAVQFRVQVPAHQPTGPIIGRVTISRQTVPIGHITFKLLIEAHDFPAENAPTRQERAWVPYKKAFISYASPDRKEVLKRVQMLDLEGIKFFQDALRMEPGQRWEQQLYREIDQCDVFYLFWSTAAKQSKWVMREVHYALERKGDKESAPPAIIPVIIEGPPPVPPPPELAHLHFDHYVIYFMV